MAGIRQHYLPRFLLKGFASKEKKDQKCTYVFTKDAKAYETNIINIGLERQFYDSQNNHETDEAVTVDEEQHFPFVSDLRALNETTKVDPQKSMAFIAHMFKRTKHTRESIVALLNGLVGVMQNSLNSGANSQQRFADLIKKNRGDIAELMKKKLTNQYWYLSPVQLDALIQIQLNKIIKEPSQAPQEFFRFSQGVFNHLTKDAPQISKSAQNRALLNNKVKDNYFRLGDSFEWRVFFSDSSNYILGDVGPIGRSKSENEYKTLIPKGQNIEEIVLPISDKHLLVGGYPEIFLSEYNAKSINRALSSLSKFFFVSARNDEKIEELVSFIGTNAEPLDDNDMAKIYQRLERELFDK